MVDLLTEGALYRRTSHSVSRLAGVNIFSLSAFPLENLFIRLATVATGESEVWSNESLGKTVAGKDTVRARTFFHMLSMGARSACEFIVTLVAAIAALSHNKLAESTPEFLAEAEDVVASLQPNTTKPSVGLAAAGSTQGL